MYPFHSSDTVLPPTNTPHSIIDRSRVTTTNLAAPNKTSRRELVCRSTGDELSTNYQHQYLNYTNHPNKTNPQQMSQNITTIDPIQVVPNNLPAYHEEFTTTKGTHSTPKGRFYFLA